jgi:serine/threonine protein kinase
MGSDFGLVLPLSGATTQLTTKSVWGTRAYAAPEQALAFHDVSPQADIYSFGCMLHDFFGEEERIPFRRYTAEGAIGVVIEKCTELEPVRRFQTVAQLRQELLPILDGTALATGAAASHYLDLIRQPSGWASPRTTM